MTVEAVLWMPILVGIVGLVADLSSVYTANAEMWRIAADASRRMSVREWTADDAETRVRAALPQAYRDAAVIEAVGGDRISVSVQAPVSALGPVGIYAIVNDAQVSARVLMRAEGSLVPDFSNIISGTGAGAPAGGA